MKIKNLIQRVILSATATLLSQNLEAKNIEEFSLVSDVDNFHQGAIKNKLTPKLLLKFRESGWSVKSHRSHRSHSSHRSHYSSSSGSGSSGAPSSPPSTGTQSSGTLGLKSGGGSLHTSLGSRVLKRGMVGYDVTELVNILLKLKYLKLEDGSTYITGETTFDLVVENAVKSFQKNNKITATGIVDLSTAYLLKN